MVKRHDRKPDGKYHIGNQKYDMLEGSRAQVWHGTAHQTPGGLKKVDLKIDICDFRFQNIDMKEISKTCERDSELNMFYFKINFKDKFEIRSDIKISVAGGGIEFYIWANLWYSCYSNLKIFLEKSKENEVFKYFLFFSLFYFIFL